MYDNILLVGDALRITCHILERYSAKMEYV